MRQDYNEPGQTTAGQDAEDEARWDETLATPESQELLARMADDALIEYRAGRTTPLDPDDLDG